MKWSLAFEGGRRWTVVLGHGKVLGGRCEKRG